MSLPADSSATRYQKARDAARELRQKLTGRGRETRLEVDFFDITGAPIKELPGEPTAGYTDLTQALRRTMARMRGRPLAAVVLLSDGADTSGAPSFQLWEDSRVPIHTAGF